MDEAIPYCYCFVRSDLSPSQQIVQLGHACLEAGKEFGHAANTHLIVFRVKNERKLLNAAVDLKEAGVRFACFFEPDDQIGYSAVATEAVYGLRRKIFERFALV